MPDESHDPIARQDELLELLFWFEGERITGAATIPGMSRFIARSEAEVQAVLDRLVQRGDVSVPDEPGGEYRLTETGRREAGRRFAEEFAPLLSQGHGECSEPDCDCHTNPAGAAECHGRAGHSH